MRPAIPETVLPGAPPEAVGGGRDGSSPSDRTAVTERAAATLCVVGMRALGTTVTVTLEAEFGGTFRFTGTGSIGGLQCVQGRFYLAKS